MKQSTTQSQSTNPNTKHGSYVYVRVRPLLPAIDSDHTANTNHHHHHEQTSKDDGSNNVTNVYNNSDNTIDYSQTPPTSSLPTLLNGLQTDTCLTQPVYALNGKLPICGFHGLLGTNETNTAVFRTVFLPRLDTVMNGGTSSFFCYGYTGAGKTHTALGSCVLGSQKAVDGGERENKEEEEGEQEEEGEPGLYQLAVEELLTRINRLNNHNRIHNYTNNNNNQHQPSPELMLIATAVEIYNDDVYDLLAPPQPTKTKCTLRKNHKGQLLIRGATQKIPQSLPLLDDESSSGVAADTNATNNHNHTNNGEYTVTTSTLTAIHIRTVTDLRLIQTLTSTHRSVGQSTTHSRSSRSHAVFRLEIVSQPFLDAVHELEKVRGDKPYVQTLYDRERTYRLRHRVMDMEKRIEELEGVIEDMLDGVRDNAVASDENGNNNDDDYGSLQKAFGGRLILVDLAGADGGVRDGEGFTPTQKRESTAINKSLLALKECIRGLQSRSTRSLPFRNSSLTRLLEEVLTPRKKRDSDSVMVVNVSPSEHLRSKTLNSLRYGSMFFDKGGGKGGTNPVMRRRGVGGGRGRGGSVGRSRVGGRGGGSSSKFSLLEAKRRMREQMENTTKEKDAME